MAILDDLFSRHYDDVYRYLYSLCHDASLSEDLTSEVFLEVVKSICGFRGESDIKTWLFSIARHRWFHYLKKKKQQPEFVALSAFEEAVNWNAQENSRIKPIADKIYELIEDEPERARKTMKLRLDGYSFYEISVAVGISESSARLLFFRTKEKIRKKLKEEGFTYE